MEIVVTDGYTLNPGDLDWKDLRSLGNVTIFDRTPISDIHHRCNQADILVINKTPLSAETLAQLPKLKMISVTATGYNIVDVIAAQKQQITVCNVPGYGTASVAQHTFALLLELMNRVGVHSNSVAQGDWQHSDDWSYTRAPIYELAGKKLGIVGLGNIGSQVARIAQSFDMEVMYFSRSKKETAFARYGALEDLFRECDILSLHCPLDASNTGFVHSGLLSKMKKSAFLINTSRGGLINESDLALALQNKMLAGAALDVLSTEPPPDPHPLIGLKNCLVTPHLAWTAREARERVLELTVSNIRKYLEGKPVNKVC